MFVESVFIVIIQWIEDDDLIVNSVHGTWKLPHFIVFRQFCYLLVEYIIVVKGTRHLVRL